MKYPKIQELVPQGEHFDESAILHEGGYLSTAHLAAIENDLATNAPALEQANATIEAHVSTIEELNGTITSMQTGLDTTAASVASQTALITDLQAQIAELGKGSSGTGSKLHVKEEVVVDPNAVPKHLDDNDPANKWADAQLARMRKK